MKVGCADWLKKLPAQLKSSSLVLSIPLSENGFHSSANSFWEVEIQFMMNFILRPVWFDRSANSVESPGIKFNLLNFPASEEWIISWREVPGKHLSVSQIPLRSPVANKIIPLRSVCRRKLVFSGRMISMELVRWFNSIGFRPGIRPHLSVNTYASNCNLARGQFVKGYILSI